MTKSSEAPGPASSGSRPGLVLTAIGRDRPGLVNEIASHIRKLEGNLEDTRMSKLGGEFALLMLVTGSAQALSTLSASIPQLETALGLSCFARNTQTGTDTTDVSVQVEISGIDRPGIVEFVTQILAERKANVTSMQSHLDNAPHTGTPLFILDATLTLPQGVTRDALETELSDACANEDLEFSFSQP